MRTFLCVAALACAASLAAQTPLAINPFASRVITHDDRGGLGGGIFSPQNALGRPDGATGVHSLGIGGSLTLGFDVVIVDGPGADLIVAENPFRSTAEPWRTFTEACFVEVSSNGVDFARLPARYHGPQVDPGPFAFVDVAHYGGLAGTMPVDVFTTDPQDVVLAGGDAFDLADLIGDPLVTSGLVDLDAIAAVRLVDAVSGTSVDSRGVSIRDTGAGSADIDGVTAVQHTANQSARGPRVELEIPADGNYRLTVSDPDGIADLDAAAFHVALYGIRVPATALVQASVVTEATATRFTLRLGAALPPGFPLQMTVSVRDVAGHRSGASRTRPL